MESPVDLSLLYLDSLCSRHLHTLGLPDMDTASFFSFAPRLQQQQQQAPLATSFFHKQANSKSSQYDRHSLESYYNNEQALPNPGHPPPRRTFYREAPVAPRFRVGSKDPRRQSSRSSRVRQGGKGRKRKEKEKSSFSLSSWLPSLASLVFGGGGGLAEETVERRGDGTKSARRSQDLVGSQSGPYDDEKPQVGCSIPKMTPRGRDGIALSIK